MSDDNRLHDMEDVDDLRAAVEAWALRSGFPAWARSIPENTPVHVHAVIKQETAA